MSDEVDEPGVPRSPDRDAHDRGRVPGERPARTLDRAPGDRYHTQGTAGQGDPAQAGGLARAAGGAAVVAAPGAGLFAVIGSFDLGPGLLVVAAFIGWAVALGFVWGLGGSTDHSRSTRVAISAGLATGSVLGGLLLLWAWSMVEGGVLGPIEYVDQRFGVLGAAFVAVAAATGALRAR
jgi:hypothetical protein